MKHNSVGPLRSIPRIRRTLSAIAIVLSIVSAFSAFGAAFDPSWTYQGQLQRNGAAYNGTCNFQFSLWDAASGGTQNRFIQSIDGVNVVNGLFTVLLDFRDLGLGTQPFTGNRWLATSVQCSGDGGFTPLDPRQPITPTPYALTLVPGAVVPGALTVDVSLDTHFTDGTAISAFGGDIGVDGGGSRYGVIGSANDPGGKGVWGSGGGDSNSAGVLGTNSNGPAIWGVSTGTGSAIYGESRSSGPAGRFTGTVSIEGSLFVTGGVFKSSGNFRIDHPLDPANKFLSHSFVESPDMKNIYEGNVTTDATGSATVTLPDYFAALNRDYHYQLTVLGQFAQAIVSRKIAGNTFEIRTDKPCVEVSWLVTGIRQDAYAQANPIVVEESKPAEEQGLYLFPAGFGAGEEKQIGYPTRPATAPAAQQPPATGPGDQASK